MSPRKRGRPIIDFREPTGFSRYPYYTVREVAHILCLSDDLVRKLFRNGKHGPVLEICNARPGKRTYSTLVIPYSTSSASLAGPLARGRSTAWTDDANPPAPRPAYVPSEPVSRLDTDPSVAQDPREPRSTSAPARALEPLVQRHGRLDWKEGRKVEYHPKDVDRVRSLDGDV